MNKILTMFSRLLADNGWIEEIADFGDFDAAILGSFKISAYIFYVRLLVTMSFNQDFHWLCFFCHFFCLSRILGISYCFLYLWFYTYISQECVQYTDIFYNLSKRVHFKE